MFRSILAALCLACSCQVNATLITADWKTAGDGLIVHDTLTDLDWLGFSETRGDHQQIRAELGTTYEGFRFATAEELMSLVRAYVPGFVASGGFQFGNNAQIASDVADLTAALHFDRMPTSFVNTCEFAEGCDAAAVPSFGVGIKRHIISFGDTDPDSYYLQMNNDNQFADRHALVRVPEPATAALLGLGLLGMAAGRRRHHHHHH